MTSTLPIHGDRLFQRRARQALPILVGQAWANHPVTYGGLAKELGMPNPRNLNHVLGAIGYSLVQLEDELGIEIPPIQALVVNSHTKVPGQGLAEYLTQFPDFAELTLSQKWKVIDRAHAEIFTFLRWNDVLNALGLPPPSGVTISQKLIQRAAALGREGGHGEGEDHRRFKEYLAENFRLLGLPGRIREVQKERTLPSGDRVDIFIRTTKVVAAVEIKAAGAGDAELVRGLFQCVKYHAILAALAKLDHVDLEPVALLALEMDLPSSMVRAKNRLGVRTIVPRYRDAS